MTIQRAVPPFVAHHVFVNTIINLKTNTAIIRSMKDNTPPEKCPLKLPLREYFDLSISLFSKEFIIHLLKKGYYPKIEGKKVKLAPPTDENVPDPIVMSRLQILCDATIDQLSKAGFETASELLQEFRDAFTSDKMELATDLIGYLLQKRGTESVRRVHALFLRMKNRTKEAAPIFFKLGEDSLGHHNQEQAVLDLEDALACNPSDTRIYKMLERLLDSEEERLMAYYLYGALYDPKQSEKWLKEAKKYRPSEPLLVLASSNMGDDEAIQKAQKLEKERITKEPRLLSASQESPKGSWNSPMFSKVNASIKNVFQRSSSEGVMEGEEPRKNDNRFRVPPARTSRGETSSEEKNQSEPKLSSSLGTSISNIKNTIRGKMSRPASGGEVLEESIPEEKSSPQKGASFKQRKWHLIDLVNRDERRVLPGVLEAFWEHYLQKKNWRKAEIIAQLMFEKFPSVESISKFVEALKMNGKREEAAKLLFSIATSSFKKGETDVMQACLAKIDELDPKWEFFSPNRKRILYLLNPLTPRVLELEPKTPDMLQEDYIWKNGFFMDHPKFVACIVNRDRLYLIGTDHVVVSSPAEGEKSCEYELVLPDDLTATTHEILSKKRHIRKLIRSGYVPVIHETNATLALPQNPHSLAPFRVVAELLLDEINPKSGLGCALNHHLFLQQFLEYLEKSPALALDALKQASESKLPNDFEYLQPMLLELYADCLYTRQKWQQAATLYNKLATLDPERKRFFLERAFMSLPTNSIFDKELSRVESDDKRKHFRHLFGYLHCQGTDLGQEFFRRTAMQDPYINLAVLNRIPRQDKQMRIKTFIQLSNIKGESPTYYRTCSRVENNTTHESKEGIVRLIEDCTEIKDQRTMALKILDVLIDSKDFELAVKVVQLVTDILRKNSSEEWRQQNKNPQLRFEGDGGAFGRRELVIYDALDQPEEMKSVVKRLLSIYNPDRKFDKAFKVAELSFRRCKTFENTCVTSLRRQNKRKEAAHAALNITFLLVTSKEFVRAQGMLSTLKRMNPQLDLFNSEEQLMIQLLESHIQKQLSHQ